MFRWYLVLTVLFLMIGSFATPASAQIPKVGRAYYEDDFDLGFKFKPPSGWSFIPAQPNEVNLIGKYEPRISKYISLDKANVLFLHCWILKFDRKYKSRLNDLGAGASRADAIKAASKDYYKDLDAWLLGNSMEVGKGYSKIKQGNFKVGKVVGTEFLYKGTSTSTTAGNGGPAHFWGVRYKIDEDRDIVMAFIAPAETKKWKKWYPALKKIAKTYKPVEVEAVEASAPVAGGGSLRAKKKAQIEARLRGEPGWKLFETPNYFVVTSHDDNKFVEEMMSRLEAIRKVYEADYPIEKAMEAQKAKAEREGKRGGSDKDRTVAAKADPMEQSRTSVVRLCKNKTEYEAYGGSPRSAGYWNWVDEELVIFDDQDNGGRRNTWAVLNHEAFHQYIFYFYGNISPHSWYNEGTGDFYSGLQLNRRKKFELKRFDWRNSIIKEEIKSGKIAPLKDLVRWSQGKYYGNNPLDSGGGSSRYPQGWSFVYFLRTGKKNKARGWDDDWGSILGTYLDTLAKTGDLDEAVDAAFEGVDWDAIETSWQTYILKGK